MNISLTNKQALDLVILLEKEKKMPLISMQINNNFKKIDFCELVKLELQYEPTFTIEFQIKCVKCAKEFESIAVKNKTPPLKHSAKCPNCNTKHLWFAKTH